MAELTNVDLEGLNDYADTELVAISDACKRIIYERKRKHIEAVLKALKSDLDNLNQLCDNPCVYFTGDMSLEEIYCLIKDEVL